TERRPARGEVAVFADLRPFAVIEAGAPQPRLVELESERVHEVQRRAGIRAQAYDVAGVRGYLGLKKHDMEHAQASPLATGFCGLTLANPIVLLSGCVGFGDEY